MKLRDPSWSLGMECFPREHKSWEDVLPKEGRTNAWAPRMGQTLFRSKDVAEGTASCLKSFSLLKRQHQGHYHLGLTHRNPQTIPELRTMQTLWGHFHYLPGVCSTAGQLGFLETQRVTLEILSWI